MTSDITLNPTIVALDVPEFEEAKPLVDLLDPYIDIYKVGSQMFTAYGPFLVRYIQSRGKKVFLDLKFHDIPNTVANAVRSAVQLGSPAHQVMDEKGHESQIFEPLFMLTVHIQGGKEMMQRAVEAARDEASRLGLKTPEIVGITVLTSDVKADNIQEIVLQRASLAKESGLDGVVASGQEVEVLRREFGNDLTIVTPGIRPLNADAGDQKRITTPGEAIRNGSSYLVIGRPIVKSNSPLETAKQILDEIKAA